MNIQLRWNRCCKSKSNLDVKRLAEINAKMMLEICYSSTSAVGVKILLAVDDSVRRQDKRVEF